MVSVGYPNPHLSSTQLWRKTLPRKPALPAGTHPMMLFSLCCDCSAAHLCLYTARVPILTLPLQGHVLTHPPSPPEEFVL